MNSKFSNRFVTSLTAMILAAFSISVGGCPDYSHQRDVPDYKNMTDGGGETSVDERVAE